MLPMDEIEPGLMVTHKATGFRYSVVDHEDDEVLLSPEQSGLQDLTVALALFQAEFVSSERFRGTGGRRGGKGKRRAAPAAQAPALRPRLFVTAHSSRRCLAHAAHFGGSSPLSSGMGP